MKNTKTKQTPPHIFKGEKFQVVDVRTKEIKGVYSTRRRASKRADSLDLEYGAIGYYVKRIEVDNS